MTIIGTSTIVLRVLLAVATCTAAVGAASAQDKPASPGGETPPPGQELVLVGCLVRIDTSAWRPGTTGSTRPGTSVSSSNSGFALKEAAVAPKEGASAPVATRSQREFSIARSDKMDLAPHVNHQVEVKGRLGEDAANTRTGTASDGPVRPASGSLNTAEATLHISAIRSIADSCPPR